MLPMLDKTNLKNNVEIDESAFYTTTQVGAFVKLSAMHVGRLADAGEFDGWYRKSPVAGSPRVFPGHTVVKFIAARELNK